jgi:hypothetical protein
LHNIVFVLLRSGALILMCEASKPKSVVLNKSDKAKVPKVVIPEVLDSEKKLQPYAKIKQMVHKGCTSLFAAHCA